jgi:hypothetical protein
MTLRREHLGEHPAAFRSLTGLEVGAAPSPYRLGRAAARRPGPLRPGRSGREPLGGRKAHPGHRRGRGRVFE